MLARQSTIVARRIHCLSRSLGGSRRLGDCSVLQIRPSCFGPPAIAGGVSISTSKARNYRGSLAVEAEMGGGQEIEAAAAAGGSSASHKHSNRLAQEHSPYLLQHAHNPVRKISLFSFYAKFWQNFWALFHPEETGVSVSRDFCLRIDMWIVRCKNE